MTTSAVQSARQTSRREFLRTAAAGAVLAALSIQANIPTATAATFKQSNPTLQAAINASVLVITLDNTDKPIASGSGTIVDPRGFILTNFHVVGDNKTGVFYNKYGLVAVAMTTNPRVPAQLSYFARVVPAASSPALDVALLQIIADTKGKEITTCLSLPTVPIGDSDNLEMRDNLTLLGYPGVGGKTLTVTTGDVSGFDTSGLIKTSAEIGPGSSGGGAYDQEGTLVGIPSAGNEDSISGARLGLIIPINVVKPFLVKLRNILFLSCFGLNITSGSLTLADFQKIEQRYKLPLNEFFQTRRTWPETDDAYGRKQLINDVYTLTVKRPNANLWATWEKRLDKNYIVQLDINFPQPGPGYTSGIMFDCNSREWQSLMTFRISSNGYWGVDTYVDGDWVSERSRWQQVTNLIVPNGTNMLWLVRTATEAQFWINSNHVGTLALKAPDNSYIGMVAQGHNDLIAPAKIQLDNLRVRIPS